MPIGVVVNEIATNAIKHTFPSRKGAIRIGLKRQVDDFIRLSARTTGSVRTRQRAQKGRASERATLACSCGSWTAR
ncbi:hypothetical protein [Microvirga ossetica]|uniref:hypothetical protein n=1 Tax=Microvirga ossetica TaxID=1882682 RepID=UPI0012FFE768|nr:hypothetical protein [Microvirga ossetica]